MSLADTLKEQIDATCFVDTHEHLIEEQDRLAGRFPQLGCNDWSTLLAQYVCDDLASGGLPKSIARRFHEERLSPEIKFDLVAPYWSQMRRTGYGLALRHTLSALYDVDDLTRETAPIIAERYEDKMRPGFYDHILKDVARVKYCQVNSLQTPVFMQTSHAGLLAQDINITDLVSPIGNQNLDPEHTAHKVSLEAWEKHLRDLFDRFGPEAVAVKCGLAYQRRLDFNPVDRRRAASIFREGGLYQWAPPDDIKELEDYLLRFCIELAIEHSLPVKFHTGHHVGCGTMKIAHVAQNPSDLAYLFRDYPDATFVVFHIGYPFQDAFISLAKHYPNVVIDMCWAWIIDPVTSTEFLRKFLLAVPANKVLTFGGDFFNVEPVVGHAEIARIGLARTLESLVADRWMSEEDTKVLIPSLMYENAEKIYDYPVQAAASHD